MLACVATKPVKPCSEASFLFFTVFQQKAARRQSDGDKLHGPKKQGIDMNFSFLNNL